MRVLLRPTLAACLLAVPFQLSAAPRQPAEALTAALGKVADILAPGPGVAPQTYSAELKLTRSEGLPSELKGRSIGLAFQAPDRLKLSGEIDKQTFAIGRSGQEMWIHAPSKHFATIGKPGVARFLSNPDKKDDTQLPPMRLPLPREQLALLPVLMKLSPLPTETIDGEVCDALEAQAQPQAVAALHLPEGTWQLWIRQSDSLPVRIRYTEGKTDIQVEFAKTGLAQAWPAGNWQLSPNAGDKVETVALGHLTRFIKSSIGMLGEKIPTLGAATGERKLLATEGKGRLEDHDGTKVLFLKGTPEEMGQQHGVLMKKKIHHLVERVLYGIGVGSSYGEGRWFFGEMEHAEKRLNPFVAAEYYREMDAMAKAAGVEQEEMRLSNLFPEMFHCSGFSIYGDATEGGRMYHGRILDYMKGIGLEQNAAVIVHQPDGRNAWVNIGYAGFVGSVTAMNEKHISIGEMGGRGEGNWDGKPMAQLVREVMEKANTLDEAVEIMRKSPRTCEYYYVISDSKAKRAVGIAATPSTFEVVLPGVSHPKLKHAIKDAVLMSAGDRYETLSKWVKEGYGKFNEKSARDLMKRPVCMTSNIHSVLFAPDTLDFWVANADSQNVASNTRYTHYNLAELLKPLPQPHASK